MVWETLASRFHSTAIWTHCTVNCCGSYILHSANKAFTGQTTLTQRTRFNATEWPAQSTYHTNTGHLKKHVWISLWIFIWDWCWICTVQSEAKSMFYTTTKGLQYEWKQMKKRSLINYTIKMCILCIVHFFCFLLLSNEQLRSHLCVYCVNERDWKNELASRYDLLVSHSAKKNLTVCHKILKQINTVSLFAKQHEWQQLRKMICSFSYVSFNAKIWSRKNKTQITSQQIQWKTSMNLK